MDLANQITKMRSGVRNPLSQDPSKSVGCGNDAASTFWKRLVGEMLRLMRLSARFALASLPELGAYLRSRMPIRIGTQHGHE